MLDVGLPDPAHYLERYGEIDMVAIVVSHRDGPLVFLGAGAAARAAGGVMQFLRSSGLYPERSIDPNASDRTPELPLRT
jgi:hypothetical protein